VGNAFAFYRVFELSSGFVELGEFVAELIKLVDFIHSLGLESFTRPCHILKKYFRFCCELLECVVIGDILIRKGDLNKTIFGFNGRDRLKDDFIIGLSESGDTYFLSC
jgi:hypothetical protein